MKISLKFVPDGLIDNNPACMNYDYNFTECYSWRSNKQYSINGSDNGLAPTRRQAIIWTNVGTFTNAYMRRSASMS